MESLASKIFNQLPDFDVILKKDFDYSSIQSKGNALVILPTFTASAYLINNRYSKQVE